MDLLEFGQKAGRRVGAAIGYSILLGPLGLLVAVPGLAVIMVIVRRILLSRIYEGQGFRRTTRERPLILRLPTSEKGVIIPSAAFDVIGALERRGTPISA